MKTTTIILALLFTLHASVLTAGNDIVGSSSAPSTKVSTINLSALVPSTPAEATFEEIVTFIPEPGDLAPATPVEAEFEVMDEPSADLTFLAPELPMVADFEF